MSIPTEGRQERMNSEAGTVEPTAGPNSDPVLVEVHPGAGVIDRHENVLLVIPVVGTHQWPQVKELLELWHRPGAHIPNAQERTADALLTAAEAGGLPGLVLLHGLDGDVDVRAYGDVEVTLDGSDQRSFSGTDARPWVARRVPGSVSILRVLAGGAAGSTTPGPSPFHLEGGTVPGSGVTLHRAGLPPPLSGAPQATVARKAVTFESVLLTDVAEQRPPRRPALPLEDPADLLDVAPEGETPEFVDGVECPMGHFNDPASTNCVTCGTALEWLPGRTVRRPRPPLGVLVTDTGSVFALTGGYVIGRAPERDQAVLSGRAKALVLHDVGQSVSRVHAQLDVSGWRVFVTDRGSANGTFISRAAQGAPWERVRDNPPTVFTPGARLRIGGRQVLFETYREEAAGRVGRL
ncbi:MAG: hypothetical protein QOE71_3982 [Pseudonocardiales bacterium]|nr:hypothetical protein [Pseudonocardiales bacterium]